MMFHSIGSHQDLAQELIVEDEEDSQNENDPLYES